MEDITSDEQPQTQYPSSGSEEKSVADPFIPEIPKSRLRSFGDNVPVYRTSSPKQQQPPPSPLNFQSFPPGLLQKGVFFDPDFQKKVLLHRSRLQDEGRVELLPPVINLGPIFKGLLLVGLVGLSSYILYTRYWRDGSTSSSSSSSSTSVED